MNSENFSDMLSRVRDEDTVDDSTDVIDLIRAKWISQRVKVRWLCSWCLVWALAPPSVNHSGVFIVFLVYWCLAALSQDRHAEFTDVKTHSFMVTTYNLNGKSPKEYLANGVDFNDWLFKVRSVLLQLRRPVAAA